MSEAKTFELLGRPVTENVKKDKDGKIEKIIYSMTNKDFDAIQAERGVTKEVKKVVAECRDVITEAAAKFVSARSLENGQVRVDVKLGNQDGAMEVKIDPYKKFTGKKPGTDETYETERFGTVTVVYNATISRELRKEGGVMDEIASAHEAAFRKAHK